MSGLRSDRLAGISKNVARTIGASGRHRSEHDNTKKVSSFGLRDDPEFYVAVPDQGKGCSIKAGIRAWRAS